MANFTLPPEYNDYDVDSNPNPGAFRNIPELQEKFMGEIFEEQEESSSSIRRTTWEIETSVARICGVQGIGDRKAKVRKK